MPAVSCGAERVAVARRTKTRRRCMLAWCRTDWVMGVRVHVRERARTVEQPDVALGLATWVRCEAVRAQLPTGHETLAFLVARPLARDPVPVHVGRRHSSLGGGPDPAEGAARLVARAWRTVAWMGALRDGAIAAEGAHVAVRVG
eukprot:345930-Prymnesium_polylepis.2